MKNLITKIQGLPESKRKIIFWILVIIIASVLLIFNINRLKYASRSHRIKAEKDISKA